MATSAEKHLMQLKGVGEVTARRLVAAGLDDFDKLAARGEVALRGIRGLNPRSIPLILEQAAALAGTTETKTARFTQLQQGLQRLQGETERLLTALQTTDPPVKKKRLAALQKEAARLGALLGRIDPARLPRPKRLGKALGKAERTLRKLEGSGPKKTVKGLKKARKRLKKELP